MATSGSMTYYQVELIKNRFHDRPVPQSPANLQSPKDVYLSIVIPAYNEGKRLPRTLRETIKFLRAQTYSSEIIIVTDGSTDDTIAVAHSFSKDFTLRVIDFQENKGKGFAVKAGLQAAEGQYRLFMDADYAVPIEYVVPFLQKAELGYEIVIASRAREDSKLTEQQSFLRRTLAQGFGCIQRLVLNLPFVDTQCGYKLFTAQVVEAIVPLVTYDCAYFDAELLYVAHKLKLRVCEIGVEWHHDQETRLPIGFKRSLDLLKKLLLIRAIHQHTALTTTKPSEKQIDLVRS